MAVDVGASLSAFSSIALLNSIKGSPSRLSDRRPVIHGSVEVVSSTRHLKSANSRKSPVTSRRKLRLAFWTILHVVNVTDNFGGDLDKLSNDRYKGNYYCRIRGAGEKKEAIKVV